MGRRGLQDQLDTRGNLVWLESQEFMVKADNEARSGQPVKLDRLVYLGPLGLLDGPDNLDRRSNGMDRLENLDFQAHLDPEDHPAPKVSPGLRGETGTCTHCAPPRTAPGY
ncbi:unnamed protein product, partial [Mesorhabditis spiculigera]